jgi:hypothetical protein
MASIAATPNEEGAWPGSRGAESAMASIAATFNEREEAGERVRTGK